MSFSSAKRRRIKPFARATSFDINVAYDIRHFQRVKYGQIVKPYFPAVGTDEAFQVMEGEILMQNNKSGVRRYGDHQMHVFSFANGLEAGNHHINANDGALNQTVDGKTTLRNDIKKSVLTNLRYAGVAVTGFQPEKDVFEQGFVLTMAGLNTLFNNGSHTLYPGSLICADIPNPADPRKSKNRALQTGVPHDKLQFVVTPYDKLSAELQDPALASKFIMGTALSYSRPGAPVDVVLHKCNVICDNKDSGEDEDFNDEDFNDAESAKPPVLAKAVKKKGKN